uniref:NADH-ubiquinone oxidoreductase chain 4 n=1 Tax=Dypsocus coleoptratus TaxID=297941 RepID=A0A8K1ZFC5_9NEOP|nr:NADH dehydrogenase subunit 4 [Dypsocus coleoptratus]
MLKYLFMSLFLIPFSVLSWLNLQIVFVIFTCLFMTEMGEFMYMESLGWGYGMDLMSYMLILLSFWICLFMLLSSEKIFFLKFYSSYFNLVLIFLMMFLYLSFYSMNLFMFYLFFESSLIPTFMIILGWGYQSERVQAGIYLLMYTLFSSLPLLLMIFYVYEVFYTLSLIVNYENNFMMNFGIFLFLYSAFLVKLPMFLVHLWLPKAHVEAPVSGSMILAGVLLKLGGYGILRISSLIFFLVYKYLSIFTVISLIGGVLISLNCLRQSDMKLLVAYSSVSHMGIMLSGMFSCSVWGVSSSLCMMLSHGLCSSGLFYLINVCYERVGSRSLYLVKGMIHLLPKMTIWWFLFCCLNMACPPSLNLLSEIGLINSIVAWSLISMLMLMLMSFLAAGYSLYLFSFSQHGKFSILNYSFGMNSIREYFILFMHWWPLNMFIVNSELFMSWI